MQGKIIFKYSFIVLAFYACNQSVKKEEDKVVNGINKIDHLIWLIGEWKSVSKDGTLYENWAKVDEKLFSGKSFLIAGKDTLFSEKIALQQNGSDLYYTPTVGNQNNGQPVPFKFIEFKDGEYIFENKEHDFPQRIIYKNPQPDFLCARIEGSKDGKFRKEDFNFVRVK